MQKPPFTRRGALTAMLGAAVAFGVVAAPTNPGDYVDPRTTGKNRVSRRGLRSPDEAAHDFDAMPPEKKIVLTRRGRRELAVRRDIWGPPAPEGDVTVVVTRRGRRTARADADGFIAQRR